MTTTSESYSDVISALNSKNFEFGWAVGILLGAFGKTGVRAHTNPQEFISNDISPPLLNIQDVYNLLETKLSTEEMQKLMEILGQLINSHDSLALLESRIKIAHGHYKVRGIPRHEIRQILMGLIIVSIK